MSIAEDIKAAASEVGTSAQAAADRVTQVVADLRAQLDELRTQLQAMIDADSVETAELEEALATLNEADAAVDSIEAAPAEEPPAEEVPPS